MHCTSKAFLTGAFGPAFLRSSNVPPSFLIPSITISQIASFSSTRPQARKDRNPNRGVSALRRTGLSKRQRPSIVPRDPSKALRSVTPRILELGPDDPKAYGTHYKRNRLNIDPASLPQPVRDPKRRTAVEVDENHGLWDFFSESRAALMTPTELASHGRGWYVQELRRKDWDDLHRLWWVCVKETNRIKTFKAERERIGKMYGDYEADARLEEIRVTVKAIRFVLTERWYTWENAREKAMEDESVNLAADPTQGESAWEYAQGSALESPDDVRMPLDIPTEATRSAPPPGSPITEPRRGGSEARL